MKPFEIINKKKPTKENVFIVVYEIGEGLFQVANKETKEFSTLNWTQIQRNYTFLRFC